MVYGFWAVFLKLMNVLFFTAQLFPWFREMFSHLFVRKSVGWPVASGSVCRTKAITHFSGSEMLEY